MKLHHIALAALATIAGQAHALDNATLNNAATLKVYVSGASALKAAVGQMFTQNCAAGTRTDYTTAVILPPATAAFSSTIYACTLIAGNDFGLPANTNVAFQKRDEGGSGMGVYPVANGAAIEFIDPTTCTGPASGAGTCTGLTTVVPQAGVSDVEPSAFAAAANTPVEFEGSSIASGTMTVRPIVQTIFGLAVSNALYTKLQADQGVATRPVVSPHAAGMMLRSGYPFGARGWTPLLPNTVDGTQDDQVTICRRVNGSGTQTSANRFFLEYDFNKSISMEPLNQFDSTAVAHGTANNQLYVVEGSATSDVRNCLTAANSAGAFAIGHISLENAETAAWKFVKLGGQEPSRDNAKVGKYAYVVESTCQVRNAVTGTAKTLLDNFCINGGRPDNLAQLAPATQNGVMALPTNPGCNAAGAATPNGIAFCSKVTRGGNTGQLLRFN